MGHRIQLADPSSFRHALHAVHPGDRLAFETRTTTRLSTSDDQHLTGRRVQGGPVVPLEAALVGCRDGVPVRVEFELRLALFLGQTSDVDEVCGGRRGGRRSDGWGRGGDWRVERSGLEVLDFHTAIQDADSHHGEEVLRRSTVIVHATHERGSGVRPDGALDEVSSTRVFLGEGRDVVDEPADDDQRTCLCLGLEVVPRDDRQMVAVVRPRDLSALLCQLLQLHGVLALLDLVVGEFLEVRRETEQRHGRDEPFGRVVLEPPDGVPKVHGELVVEVVVTFSDGDERGDKVITRGVLVVERSVTEPMGEGVYAERRVVNESQPGGSGKEESAPPVSPTETGDEGRDEPTHGQHQREVVDVLPPNDLVASQVGDIGGSDLGSWLEDHPSDMSPPETFVSRVRIKLGVGVPMMSTVTSRPPLDGPLDRSSTAERQRVLQRFRRVVRSMRPETMVTRGDT